MRHDAAASVLFVSALRPRPHVRRRAAETAAEGAVEVGQVGESGVEGDGADGAAGTTWIREHLVRAHEPLRQHEFRERCGLGRKQHVDVARRDAEMRRHGRHRQLMAGKVLRDERLGRAQPRRAHAASCGNVYGIARGAEREGEKIVDVGDRELLQLRRSGVNSASVSSALAR
jgi:hypothetical protein